MFISSGSGGSSKIVINGTTVESNKGGYGIGGGKITYNDGSTYDVRTGEFINRGPGWVKVNGRTLDDNSPPSSSTEEEHITKEIKLGGSFLVLNISRSQVAIEPTDELGITAVIEGSQSAVEAVDAETRGCSACVSDVGVNAVSSSSSSISVSNVSVSGDIFIGNVRNGPDLKITIRVPRGTPISLTKSGMDDLTIGDIRSPLEINKSGMGKLTAESAFGNVTINASGMGDVQIKSGEIRSLLVDKSGMGKVKIKARAQHARLIKSGMGDIVVDHVVNKPVKVSTGMGKIKIKRVGA